MCVFKRQDGSYEQHHFEIDQAKKTITIWEQWQHKGDKIFDGTYQMSGDELRLRGKFQKRPEGTGPAPPEETTLVLKKRGDGVSTTRGSGWVRSATSRYLATAPLVTSRHR
jgi:hypothetical protein